MTIQRWLAWFFTSLNRCTCDVEAARGWRCGVGVGGWGDFCVRPAYQHGSGDGQLHDLFLGGIANIGDFSGDSSLVHDEDTVAHTEDFGQFGADHKDGFSLLGEVVDEEVEFVFGADVDAAGGFVEDDDVAVTFEPFSEDDFLLVAAGEVLDDFVVVGNLDAQVVDVSGQGVSFASMVDEAEGGKAGQVGQREVFADGVVEDEPVGFSVFGEQADAFFDRVAR